MSSGQQSVLYEALDDLKADPRCQARECMDEQALEEYAAAYRNGETLPPLDCFEVEGELVIVDGFHRHEAARRAGVETLPVRMVGRGSMPDAEWHALGSNQKHGLRRTREDKRNATRRALELDADRTDREIARHVGVSHPFVGKIRREQERSKLPSEWFDANLIPPWAVEVARRHNDPSFRPETGIPVCSLPPRYFVRLKRLRFLCDAVPYLSDIAADDVATLRDTELMVYELIVYIHNDNAGVMEDLCAAMRREFEPEILAEIALAKTHGMDVWLLRMLGAVILAAEASPEVYGDLLSLPTIGAAYRELRRRSPEWRGVRRPWPDVFPDGFRSKETWRDYAVLMTPEAA